MNKKRRLRGSAGVGPCSRLFTGKELIRALATLADYFDTSGAISVEWLDGVTGLQLRVSATRGFWSSPNDIDFIIMFCFGSREG